MEDLWRHPDLDDNVVYLDAGRWIYDYTPSAVDREVYTPALKFAEKQYEYALKLSEGLDKKSDDIIRTAGVIAGVVATAGKLQGVESVLGNSYLIVVALLCLIFAVLIAIRARAPAELATPMDVRSVLAVAEYRRVESEGQTLGPTTDHVMEAVVAASYHYAIVGMNIINAWKAKQLDRSTLSFCLGIATLVLQLIIPRLSP